MILCVLKRILLVLWEHFRTPWRKKCLITDRNLGQSFYVVGVQFLCFRVTLVIASRSPFEIFAFGAITDELQVRARKEHTVSEARAHSRFRSSISLFLSHFWHCLQVSLWSFCIWCNRESLLFPKMEFFYKSSYLRFDFLLGMQNWVFL